MLITVKMRRLGRERSGICVMVAFWFSTVVVVEDWKIHKWDYFSARFRVSSWFIEKLAEGLRLQSRTRRGNPSTEECLQSRRAWFNDEAPSLGQEPQNNIPQVKRNLIFAAPLGPCSQAESHAKLSLSCLWHPFNEPDLHYCILRGCCDVKCV